MFEEIPKEQVIQYFQTGKFQELLNYYCNVKENDITINYYYFKCKFNCFEQFLTLMLVNTLLFINHIF